MNRRLVVAIVAILVAIVAILFVPVRSRSHTTSLFSNRYDGNQTMGMADERSAGPFQFDSASVYTPSLFSSDNADNCTAAKGEFPLYKSDGSFDKCVIDPHIYDSPASVSRPIGQPETLNDGGVFMQNAIGTSISYHQGNDYFLLDRWKSGIQPPIEKWPTIQCQNLISKIEDTGNGNVTVTTSSGLVMHGKMGDDIYHSNQPTPAPTLMGRIRQTCG